MTDPIIYRASALGGCLRALVADRLGYGRVDPPEQLALLFKEGNTHEEAVIKQLREDGWKIAGQQQEVNLDVMPGVIVQGHLDAGDFYFPGDSAHFLLEVKSMSHDAFKDFEKHQWATPGLIQRYKWQLSAYMRATGKQCFFVAKNRNSGVLYTKIVREPFYTLDEMRARVLKAESFAVRGELPDCDEDAVQWGCPFPYLHADQPTENRVELTDAEKVESLRSLVHDYLYCKDEYETYDRRMKEIKGQIRELMGQVEKVKIDDFPCEINLTQYMSKRKSFDRDKMKGDGLDPTKYEVEDYYSALRVSRRIKRSKEAGNIVDGEIEPAVVQESD